MARKRRSRAFKDKQVIDLEQAREERRKKRAEAGIKRSPRISKEKQETSKRRVAKRNRRRLVYALILIGIIAIIGTSVFRLVSLKLEEAEAKEALANLKQEKESLEEELSQVYSKDYIEQQAREQLRMIEPGEVLYILKDEDKDAREN